MKTIKTTSGIDIKEVYTEFEGILEAPGQFPYTRGIQADMYRGKLWTMRQYAGFSTAKETNARYRYLLAQGTTGLSVAFDLPTQIGYDSDHAMAEGEVGKVGVAIDTLEDMEELFRDISLDSISTSMTINATASILLCMYIAVAKKQGISLNNLQGTIQNDILKEYSARGTFIYPPEASMRLITDIFEYCSNSVPKWNTISISGYHIREAGSTAVQELAFTMANAKAYVLAAMERGLEINVFSKRLSFFFNCHHNFFEEIAKFRAARKIWAELIQSLGATDPKAQQLRFHTQTAGSSLTAQQPLNNIVRTSMQAMAAVLGGTQSLHTNGYDEALSLPTEQSAQVALRTQQIIAFETGAADTVDPLAGSFFVENLTQELEKGVKKYLEIIDSMGGAVKALQEGYIQNEIARASYEYQKEIENESRVWVGVNRFEDDEKTLIEPFNIPDEIRKGQVEKLREFKQSRDSTQVQKALMILEEKSSTKENLIPYILHCVESKTTLGEISDVFRKVFGEYKSSF